MKKLAPALFAALILLSLCSCGRTIDGVKQSPETIRQMKIVKKLGTTVKDEKIVAYQNENDYVKYCVILYEGGKKADERTHYFYNNDYAYERDKNAHAGEPGVEFKDSKRYATFPSEEAVGDSFFGDLKALEKTYYIKREAD